jgi:hypothetical protein
MDDFLPVELGYLPIELRRLVRSYCVVPRILTSELIQNLVCEQESKYSARYIEKIPLFDHKLKYFQVMRNISDIPNYILGSIDPYDEVNELYQKAQRGIWDHSTNEHMNEEEYNWNYNTSSWFKNLNLKLLRDHDGRIPKYSKPWSARWG